MRHTNEEGCFEDGISLIDEEELKLRKEETWKIEMLRMLLEGLQEIEKSEKYKREIKVIKRLIQEFEEAREDRDRKRMNKIQKFRDVVKDLRKYEYLKEEEEKKEKMIRIMMKLQIDVSKEDSIMKRIKKLVRFCEELMKESNEREIERELTRIVKWVDDIIVQEVKKTYKLREDGERQERTKVDWMRVEVLMRYRIRIVQYRKEKWIERIMKEVMVEEKDKEKTKNEIILRNIRSKEVVYIMFNTVTKDKYVGETSKGIMVRLRQHIMDSKRLRGRKVYKIMRRIGLEKFIIIPIAIVRDNTLRKKKERSVMHDLRTRLMNDEFTFTNKNYEEDIEMEKKGNIKMRKLKILDVIKKENLDEFEDNELWNIIEDERRWRLRGWKKDIFDNKVLKRLRVNEKKMRKRYNFRVIKGTYNKRDMKREIIRKINESENSKELKKWIIDRLNISVKKDTTIRSIVNKKNRYDQKCKCSRYKEEWKKENHVSIKIENTELKNTIIGINNKTPIKETERNFRVAKEEINKEMKKIGVETVDFRKLKKTDEMKYYGQEIVEFYKRYEGLVLVQLDKNENAYYLECAEIYNEREKKFIEEGRIDKKYKKRKEKKEVIEEKIRKEWEKVNGKSERKEKFSVPKLRIIPKEKDTKKNRPIVDYSKMLGRTRMKEVGRALTVLKREMMKIWDTLELDKCDNFNKLVDKINMNEKWRKRIEKKEVIMIKLDVKNMFTNCDRKKIIKAVEAAFRDLKKKKKKTTFHIARNQLHKNRDGLGEMNIKEFKNITREEIMKAINYEFNTMFIESNEGIIEQIDGVPMGALLSCHLADLLMMYRENKKKKKWKDCLVMRGGRIRDDIWMIKEDKSKSEKEEKKNVKKIVKIFNRIYKSGLEIELEKSSKEKNEMLDVEIIVGKEKLIRHEKPIELRLEKGMNKKMTLPEIGGWETKILRNAIYGKFNRVMKNNNNERESFRDTVFAIEEMMNKKYRMSWIIGEAYRRSNDLGKKVSSIIDFMVAEEWVPCGSNGIEYKKISQIQVSDIYQKYLVKALCCSICICERSGSIS